VEGGAPGRPEPSAANPLPSLLGEDSFDAESPMVKPAAAPSPAVLVEDDSEGAESVPPPPAAGAAPSVDASTRPLGLYMGNHFF
jgi:hypothetical protein